VLLSKIYAAAGNTHLFENVEQQRKEKGVKKQLGRTWIEVNNKVHKFVGDDQDHPQTIEICAQLQRLSGLLHTTGYVLYTKSLLHDVKQVEMVSHLCHCSMKLAITLGVINIAHGPPLQIMKSLQVCEDCQTSTEFI
jgi:hypothetical protein